MLLLGLGVTVVSFRAGYWRWRKKPNLQGFGPRTSKPEGFRGLDLVAHHPIGGGGVRFKQFDLLAQQNPLGSETLRRPLSALPLLTASATR